MSSRVVHYYERTLTSQVGDIEHLESTSLAGYGVVKIFFQKDVDIAAALAQVTAASQTVLKLLPPGITPPYVLRYNASSVPILQLALSSKQLPQMQRFDRGQNFIRPQLATVAGAAVPSPYGGKILQVQIDLDQQAMQAANISADDVVDAISAQNLVIPAGDEKIGKFDWNVALNASPVLLDRINDLPLKKVNGTIIYIHDVHLHSRRRFCARWLSAADQPGPGQRSAGGADDDPQGGLGLEPSASSMGSNPCCPGSG
jgi:multidrug efflux pump subunit AcrB